MVFEDCWSILRTAMNEGMSSGPRDQVLSLYLTTIEPFFCLPGRAEELAKIKVRLLGRGDGVAEASRCARLRKGLRGTSHNGERQCVRPMLYAYVCVCGTGASLRCVFEHFFYFNSPSPRAEARGAA